MKTLITLALATCLISSCSPKIGSHIISKQPELSNNDEILVLQKNENFYNDGIEVGTIKAGDNGLSVNCSYDDVISKLKQMARSNGANIIKLIEYKDPDKFSSCVRLTARIYKVPDVRAHEMAIPWFANRKLTWDDFKASPKDYPTSNLAAQTYCSISYKEIRPTVFGHNEIVVTNIFQCDSSWVKPNQKYRSILLEHEQDHFDLAEVYARLFRKKINDNKLFAGNELALDQAFQDIVILYFKKQDSYDEETQHGLNEQKQKEWTKEINEELNKLKDYQL